MNSDFGALTVLVAARNEEDRIGETVAALRKDFPEAEILVVDGRSEDGTASRAESAGAVVISVERLGKGEALSAGERAAPPGRLLLCDADLRGTLRPLVESEADLAVAAFRRRVGGGFGLAKRVARELVRLRTALFLGSLSRGSGSSARVPAPPAFRSRRLRCEVRMTIDALRAGLAFEEIELDLDHGRRAGTVRRSSIAAASFSTLSWRPGRWRSLPWLPLPLVGWNDRQPGDPGITLVTLLGFLDDVYGGHQRGFREHLRARRTTGVLKAVGIPLVGLLRTRSLSGALVFALSANLFNQLDTKPGRCLKAYLLAAGPSGPGRPGRPPPSLRSRGEDDAGGRRIECARAVLGLNVRGPLPRFFTLGRDRNARRPQPPRRAHVRRPTYRADARPA